MPTMRRYRLGLEMYGDGEPELLNWQVLKGTLRGIGLLHYYAGTSHKGGRLEYIAVIDLWVKKLIAMSPHPLGSSCRRNGLGAIPRRGGGPARGTEPVEVHDGAQTRVATYERPAPLKRVKRASRPKPANTSISPGKTPDAIPLRL